MLLKSVEYTNQTIHVVCTNTLHPTKYLRN